MEIKYYEIDEHRARQARAMWSFTDYIPNSTTEQYRHIVDEVYNIGEQAILRAEENRHAYIEYLCNKFSKQLAEYYNKDISINLMCPSVMISGAGNFPVRKKEKQNKASDKNYQFYNKIMEIKDKINSVGTDSEIIKSNDPLAIEKLQDKIDNMKKHHEFMKSLNAYYKKHNTLIGCEDLDDITEEKTLELTNEIQNSTYGIPYATYELQNNLQNIKSAQNRLDSLLMIKNIGTIEKDTEHFKVVHNSEEMRLQLIFEGKPSEEVRSILKSNGFKWSGKNGAWQRQLTNNAKYSLKLVTEKIKKILD